MRTKATIVLADDHPLILEGNKAFLQNHGFQIVETALDGNQAYNAILKTNPQLAILDMDMPVLSGLDVATYCKEKNLPVKIIILSLYLQEAIHKEVGKTIEAYILKECALEELLTCIQSVLDDKTYISPKILQQPFMDTSPKDIECLTTSERKIIKLLLAGSSSQEIADKFFISKRTVEKHRSNIIQKLDLGTSPNALVLWAAAHEQYFR